MKQDFVNRNHGTYWRIMWSADWATRTPWTLDQEKTKYIGKNWSEKYPAVVMYTIGPIAIVAVTAFKRNQ